MFDRHEPIIGRCLGLFGSGMRQGFGRRVGFKRYLDSENLTQEELKEVLQVKLKKNSYRKKGN